MEPEPLLITVPEPELDIKYVIDFLHSHFTIYKLHSCGTAYYVKRQKKNFFAKFAFFGLEMEQKRNHNFSKVGTGTVKK